MKTVYMSFSTDMLHSGHIAIIEKAAALGQLTIGVLTDQVIASYKRYPLLSYEERVNMLQSIRGVYRTVEQNSLSYADNLRKLRPDYVVHGDDWKSGVQKPIRDEVVSILNEYGGELVEYPYSNDERYRALEQRSREHLSIPDIRRGRLRDLLAMKPTVSILEAHSGITGLIAENTVVVKEGKAFQFDGMWVSSLCDSTAKGKPDIELVDMSSRLRTIDDIMEVTTKPIILDEDTGGLIEHFPLRVEVPPQAGIGVHFPRAKPGCLVFAASGSIKNSSPSGDTTTLGPKAAVKPKNPPAIGRSILRTFSHTL